MGNIKEVSLNLKKKGKKKKRLSQINKCANNTSSPTDHLLLLLHHDRPRTFCKHNTIRICSTDKKTKPKNKTKQKHNSTLFFFPANIMLATSIKVWMETEWQHLALKNPNERKKTFLDKSMYIAVNNKMPARGQDNQFGLVFGIPRLCHRETMRTMYQS